MNQSRIVEAVGAWGADGQRLSTERPHLRETRPENVTRSEIAVLVGLSVGVFALYFVVAFVQALVQILF